MFVIVIRHSRYLLFRLSGFVAKSMISILALMNICFMYGWVKVHQQVFSFMLN